MSHIYLATIITHQKASKDASHFFFDCYKPNFEVWLLDFGLRVGTESSNGVMPAEVVSAAQQ